MVKTNRCNQYRKLEKGMTLIELLIVLVLVGSLAAIAYPSFTHQGLKAHRAAAKSDLLKIQMELEQSYDRSNPAFINGYDFELISDGGSCSASLNCQSNQERYEFSIRPLNESGGYVLTATARGQQTEDKCNVLEVQSNGELGPEECW